MQPVDSTFVINSLILARSQKASTEIKSCSWAPLADLQNGDKFLPCPCFPLLLGNLLRNGKYDGALSVLPCTITSSLIPTGKWGGWHCRVLGRRTAYGGVDKYLESECRIDNYPFNSVEPPKSHCSQTPWASSVLGSITLRGLTTCGLFMHWLVGLSPLNSI